MPVERGEPIPEKGLPKGWVVFDPCPKCGATVPKVKYEMGGEVNSPFPEITRNHAGQHFHAECWRCGCPWCADMNGRIRLIEEARK
jgi:hypothetical protein